MKKKDFLIKVDGELFPLKNGDFQSYLDATKDLPKGQRTFQRGDPTHWEVEMPLEDVKAHYAEYGIQVEDVPPKPQSREEIKAGFLAKFSEILGRFRRDRQSLIDESLDRYEQQESQYTRKYGARSRQMGRTQRELVRKIGLLCHINQHIEKDVTELLEPEIYAILAAANISEGFDDISLQETKLPATHKGRVINWQDVEMRRNKILLVFHPNCLKLYGIIPWNLAYDLQATFYESNSPEERSYTIVPYEDQPEELVQSLFAYLRDGRKSFREQENPPYQISLEEATPGFFQKHKLEAADAHLSEMVSDTFGARIPQIDPDPRDAVLPPPDSRPQPHPQDAVLGGENDNQSGE